MSAQSYDVSLLNALSRAARAGDGHIHCRLPVMASDGFSRSVQITDDLSLLKFDK